MPCFPFAETVKDETIAVELIGLPLESSFCRFDSGKRTLNYAVAVRHVLRRRIRQ